MKEIWKDVDGFEGIYQVSNIGNVKRLKSLVKCKGNSFKTVNERILKSHLSTGYKSLMITKENSRDHKLVHRLVASAFIPNPENKPMVNHINGIRNDNRVENLEWVTATENELHKVHVLKRNPAINFSTVSEVNEPIIINGKVVVGVLIQKLYKDLLSGKRLKSTDVGYGNFYAQISRLKVHFGIPVEKELISGNYKEYYLQIAS